MNRVKAKKFLGIYSKMLIIIFAFTILINVFYIFLNPSVACYERVESVNVIKVGDYNIYNDQTNSSCQKVSPQEYNKIKKSINRIGIISFFSLIGYISVYLIERIKNNKNDIIGKTMKGEK